MREINIKIKTLRSGQVAKYGDSQYEYELEVKGMDDFEVKIFCTSILKRCKQTYKEWDKKDTNSYFGGYYEFERIVKTSFSEGKYRYFVHSPSTH